MSKVYFHSQNDEAGLSGAERASMQIMIMNLFVNSLNLEEYSSRPNPFRTLFPAHHWSQCGHGAKWKETMQLYLRVSGDEILTIDGRQSCIKSCALNTAIVMGNDIVKLMAKIDGQCELHCYVEGPNRIWLASLMEEGRKKNIFRADMGWEQIIDLLRSSDDGPVVLSYSVSDQFPNKSIVIEQGIWEHPQSIEEDDGKEWDALSEKWEALSTAEQWALALEALRKRNETHHLELMPEIWDEFYFGEGISGFDIQAHLDSIREEMVVN